MSEPPPEDVQDESAEPGRFRYRLIHVVYLMTLLASSLATFGPGGLIPGFFVGICWAFACTRRSRPRALLEAGVVVLVCSCLVGLVLSASSPAREAARRMSCANNLKQIGLALHNYHDVYGSFPPAYIADETGQPKHSWRVLLLPFLEERPLYDKYNFDEPWNGPNNRKLLVDIPWPYRCPSAIHDTTGSHPCTNYVAVIGPTTAWPLASSSKLSDIKDDPCGTLLVAELGGHDIGWLEPRDLEFREALQRFGSEATSSNGNHRYETFFYQYDIGRNVLFADGSVQFVFHGNDHAAWSALLGKDDGISPASDDLIQRAESERHLKVGNCVRLAVFIVLTLLPIPWVWLNPTSGFVRG